MTVPEILAILVCAVAAPFNWIMAVTLVRLAIKSPDLDLLRFHAILTTVLAIIVTIFALVFVNNGMKPPVLDLGQTQLLTRSSLLVLSVIPAAYWYRWYRKQ